MKYFIFSFMLNLLKKLKKLVPFTAAFVISAFLFSCNNIFDTQKNDASAVNYDGEGYILTGIITMQNANYVGDARMAVPDNSGIDLTDTTNYEYKIYLDGQEKSVSVSNGVFSLGLNSGDNLVKVVVQNKQTSFFGDDIFWVPVLQSEKTVKISNDAPHTLSEKFVLSPIQDGETTGNVRLSMSLTSDIHYVTVTLLDDSKQAGWTDGFNLIVCPCAIQDNTANFCNIAQGSPLSDSYKVQLDFYDNQTEKNILYSIEQTIEVYGNLLTTKWLDTTVNSSGKPSPINNSTGKFVLTDEILEDFANTTIYVDPVRGLDNNGGTYYGKLKTLQKAVDTAILRNGIKSGTEEFNILLCGDISSQESVTIDCSTKALKLNIKSDIAGQRTIKGKNDQSSALIKIKGNGKSNTIINIDTIQIKGQKNLTTDTDVDKQGGAIYINNACLNLINCTITSNVAQKGAGIYCDTGAKITTYANTALQDNNYGDTTLTSRKGGGIYAAGEVIVNGSMYNNVAESGGGIYVSSDSNASLTFDNEAYLYAKQNDTTGENAVFLSDGKTITVGSNLTNTTVAYITPEKPAKNLVVLSSASTKFKTSYAADSYKIDNSTKLSLANIVTDIYVGTYNVGNNTYAAADPSGNTKDSSTWKHYNSSSTYFQTHPLTSIEKALQFITWQGSNEEYKIYINGTLNGAQSIANNTNTNNPITLTKNTNIKKLTLTGANSATLDGGFAKGTGGNSDKIGTTLTIDTAVPVVISSLTIKNGYQPQGNGGGIYISNANADVTVSTNTTIRDCKANKGGAIYNLGTLTFNASIQYGYALVYNGTAMGGGIYNEKTLNMTGGDIRYCKAGPETTDTVGDGAGVYLAGANSVFNMSGGYIGNGGVAKGKGGGVYVGAGSKIFMSGSARIGLNNPNDTATAGNRYNEADKGGGLYVEGEAYIGYTAVNTPDNDFSGSIKYNYAHNNGGGIYIYKSSASAGKVVMLKGSISYNGCGTSNNTAYGGGICLDGYGSNYKSTFEMLGGEMTNNKAYKKGGAVYAGNGTFDMQSGTLSSNSVRGTAADCVGGAIYIPASGGEFKIKGDATIPNGTAKNNDIYLDRYQSGGSGYNNFVHINGSLSGTDKVATLSIANNITKAFDKTDNASDTEFRAGPKRFNILSTTSNAAAADGSLYKTTFVDELLKSQNEVVLDITGKDYKLEPPTGDDSYTSSGGHGEHRDQCLIVPSGKTLKLTATSLTEISPSVLCGCFIEVSSGGTLIIGDNVKITPGDSSIWAHAIECYGTVKMQGGSISGFDCGGSSGVVYVQSGTNPGFEMTGGVIENNGPKGAVLVWTGTFNMSGGIIRNNSNNEENHAGGITVGGSYEATLIKSGGTVSGNTSSSDLTSKANNIYITANKGYYGTTAENVQNYSVAVIDP